VAGIAGWQEDEAQQLARRLGGLPLGLHLAGSYLASPFARWHDMADYRHALDSAELPVVLAELDQPGAAERVTIARTWELSLDALAVHHRPQARPLLRVLACYAPATPIPADLLRPELLADILGGRSEHPGNVDAASSQRLRDGLRALAEVGLIDVSGSGQVLIVHPVVADATRARLLAAPQTEMQQIAQVAILVVQKAWDHDREDTGNSTRLIPHMAAVLNWLGLAWTRQPSSGS
jgi:hypothetical protein